jgi:hypothetical protein
VWECGGNPKVVAVMGNACSGHDDDVLAALDTDMLAHLQREFNEVDLSASSVSSTRFFPFP